MDMHYMAYLVAILCQEEKQKIQNDLRILTERLSRINDSLSRKVASRNEYDKTIMETEAAYMKILESSQVTGQTHLPVNLACMHIPRSNDLTPPQLLLLLLITSL